MNTVATIERPNFIDSTILAFQKFYVYCRHPINTNSYIQIFIPLIRKYSEMEIDHSHPLKVYWSCG